MLANVNRVFIDTSIALRSNPSVQTLIRTYDVRRYKNMSDVRKQTDETTLEFGVDVETKSGIGFSWWMEIVPLGSSFVVKRMLWRNSDEPADKVLDYPDSTFANFDEAVRSIPSLAQEL